MGGLFSCFRGCHPAEESVNNANAENRLTNAAENSEPHVFEIPAEPRSTNSSKRFESAYSSRSSDEDVCPTCFEGYSEENPKITAKCNHHFHLGCIYDWQERSETCPFCRQVIDFSEAA